MTTVTVYSKAGFCGMCVATKRALTNAGIPFTEAALEDVDSAQIETWKTTLGAAAPIVITPAGSWSGFRPDLIAQIPSAQTATPLESTR